MTQQTEKQLCGYGCGRLWNEEAENGFVDCVSAYHIKKKVETWEEKLNTEWANKVHKLLNECGFEKTNQDNSEAFAFQALLLIWVHSFISQQIKQAKLEVLKEMRPAIGSMRQWLNEDRITDPNKMVTNENLWVWFNDIKSRIEKGGGNEN